MTRVPANGGPIVLAPVSRNIVHLPSVRRDPVSAFPVSLDELVEAGGLPPYWLALCGVRGKAGVYGLGFAHCRTCPECLLVLEELAA